MSLVALMNRVAMIVLLVARITTAQEPQSTITPHEFIEPRGYVGLVVGDGPEQDFRLIAAVMPKSPAAEAGIIAGDYIMAIDQYATAGMSLQEFYRHAWAPAYTYSPFTLKRVQTGGIETVQLQRLAAALTAGFLVFVDPERDYRLIATVIPNGPAAKAGIIAGDYVVSIGQYSTAEMSLEEFCRHAQASLGACALTLKRAQTGATETVQLQLVDAATLNPKQNEFPSYAPLPPQ